MAGSEAQLTLQTINAATPLRIDTDGNGTFETTINRGEQLTPSQLIDSLSVMVNSLNLKHGDKKSIASHLRNAQKKINDGKDKNMHSVASQLRNVEKKITHAVAKSITQNEATVVIEVLNLIRVRLGI
jgi:transposase